MPSPPKVEPRTEFLHLHCKVTAYPSVGGIVVGYFTAVQLKQLGLSNVEIAVRSQDKSEEDELALTMMRHGAHWWPSKKFYSHHSERMTDMPIPYGFHFPPRVNVGYPSSGKGVWVFKFSEDAFIWDQDGLTRPDVNRMPDDWYGRINMALDGDERCEILKCFGAKFFDNVEDCVDIPKTLLEGIERGQRYQALLEKMEDDEYLNRWLEGSIGQLAL
jgi:hypothetical protein